MRHEAAPDGAADTADVRAMGDANLAAHTLLEP